VVFVDLTPSSGAQPRWLAVRRSKSVPKERMWSSRAVAHMVNGTKGG
jgi:hypothetical protein